MKLFARRILHWLAFGVGRDVPPPLDIRWDAAALDKRHRHLAAEGFAVGQHVCLECGGVFPNHYDPQTQNKHGLRCPLCGGRQSRFVETTKFYAPSAAKR